MDLYESYTTATEGIWDPGKEYPEIKKIYDTIFDRLSGECSPDDLSIYLWIYFDMLYHVGVRRTLKVDPVRMMLERGADPNYKVGDAVKYRWTTPFWAFAKGVYISDPEFEPLLRILLQYGGNLNIGYKNDYMEEPVFEIILKKIDRTRGPIEPYLPIIELCIAYGADPYLTTQPLRDKGVDLPTMHNRQKLLALHTASSAKDMRSLPIEGHRLIISRIGEYLLFGRRRRRKRSRRRNKT